MIKTIETKLASVFNIMAFIRTVICVIFFTCALSFCALDNKQESNQDTLPLESKEFFVDEQRMEQRHNDLS